MGLHLRGTRMPNQRILVVMDTQDTANIGTDPWDVKKVSGILLTAVKYQTLQRTKVVTAAPRHTEAATATSRHTEAATATPLHTAAAMDTPRTDVGYLRTALAHHGTLTMGALRRGMAERTNSRAFIFQVCCLLSLLYCTCAKIL